MKSLFGIYSMMGLALFVGAARAAQPMPAMPAAAPSAVADPVMVQVQAIQAAKDPSAVVAAYAAGVGIDARSVVLNDAYVRKMISLRMPQLAGSQGQMLTQLDPAGGPGWAVVAFNDAQKGQMESAFANALMAAGRAPRDPFVIATAAQLVAWYDYNPDRPENTPAISALAARLRQAFPDNRTYKAYYQDAMTVLKDQAAAETQAAQAPTNPAEAVPATTPPPDQPQTQTLYTGPNYYYQDTNGLYGGYGMTPTYGYTPTYFYPGYYGGYSYYGGSPYYPGYVFGSSFAFPYGRHYDRDYYRSSPSIFRQVPDRNGTLRPARGESSRFATGRSVSGTTMNAPGQTRIVNTGVRRHSSAETGWRGSGNRGVTTMAPTPTHGFRSSGSAWRESGGAIRSSGFNGSAIRSSGFSGGAVRSSGFSGGAVRSSGFSGGAVRSSGFSGSAVRGSAVRSSGSRGSAVRSSGFSGGGSRGFSGGGGGSRGFSGGGGGGRGGHGGGGHR